MGFEIGNKLGGRTKGAGNLVSSKVKASFQLLLENNLDDIQESLDKVKESNPAEYIKLILSIATFVIPKIQPKQIIEQTAPTTYEINFQ